MPGSSISITSRITHRGRMDHWARLYVVLFGFREIRYSTSTAEDGCGSRALKARAARSAYPSTNRPSAARRRGALTPTTAKAYSTSRFRDRRHLRNRREVPRARGEIHATPRHSTPWARLPGHGGPSASRTASSSTAPRPAAAADFHRDRIGPSSRSSSGASRVSARAISRRSSKRSSATRSTGSDAALHLLPPVRCRPRAQQRLAVTDLAARCWPSLGPAPETAPDAGFGQSMKTSPSGRQSDRVIGTGWQTPASAARRFSLFQARFRDRASRVWPPHEDRPSTRARRRGSARAGRARRDRGLHRAVLGLPNQFLMRN